MTINALLFSYDLATDGTALAICGDGCGFDTKAAHTGLGLLGMKERAGMLGGQLSVQSHRGEGTEICILMPLH